MFDGSPHGWRKFAALLGNIPADSELWRVAAARRTASSAVSGTEPSGRDEELWAEVSSVLDRVTGRTPPENVRRMTWDEYAAGGSGFNLKGGR